MIPPPDNTPPVPLNRLRPGQRATVVGLVGGRGFRMRLLSMGLRVGSEVEVVHSSNGAAGPTLVAAGETRLAIGHGMAAKVLVAVKR